MKRTLLLILGGFIQSFVLIVAVFYGLSLVLDEYTSDTLSGTLIQMAPVLLGVAAIFVIPSYLALTKRGRDAKVFAASSIVSVIALTAFGFTYDPCGDVPEWQCGAFGELPQEGTAYCAPSERDGLTDEEKEVCENWCPYKGPLLGGGYWIEIGEDCVYL